MGRRYYGDISGKFLFGIQPSDDADFFGVNGTQTELSYWYTDENLGSVNKGLKKCKKALGEYKEKIREFWENNDTWDTETVAKHLKVSEEKAKSFLGWYARLELGEQIKRSIEETGQCCFDAEIE